MSILSVDNISPIGSGTTVTVNKSVTLESGNTNITGVCTATSFSGSGANLTSLPSQVTITGNADNRVITGGSGTNLNGEANVQIDSSGNLLIGTTTAVRALTIKQPGQIHLESTDTGNWLGVSLKGSSGTNNYNAYFGMLDSNGNFFIDNGSNGNDFVITQSGQVTIGGEVHIGSKLVHDGDTDTHINFSSNTIVTTAGNVTKMNVNNTMVEINGVVQRQGGRTYSTNSTSTWTNILSFSDANTNGFFFECAVSENNYSTIYKVGGAPTWNSSYFTSDHAGDSNHAHSSDITFRVLNDSGTKRLQFKAVSYTTTRYLYAINVWVRTGYVNWS